MLASRGVPLSHLRTRSLHQLEAFGRGETPAAAPPRGDCLARVPQRGPSLAELAAAQQRSTAQSGQPVHTAGLPAASPGLLSPEAPVAGWVTFEAFD